MDSAANKGTRVQEIKIETAQDLIDAIVQHPQFREEVLRYLLSQELLELPVKFEQFREEFNQSRKEFNQLRGEFNQFREETNHRLDRLESGQAELRGNVADLRGKDYERSIRLRVRERAAYAFMLSSPYIALSQNDPLSRDLDSAINRARSRNEISGREIESLLDTDIIISDEENNHATVEASITADDRDITRSRERADILNRITGGTTHAIIAAQNIADEQRRKAMTLNVTVMQIEYRG
jgi:hypothetical protein